MIPFVWHNAELRVTRLVLPDGGWTAYEQALADLAESYGLEVVHDCGLPQSGDLWLGCRPNVPTQVLSNIGIASRDEVPVAILGLLAAQYDYPSHPVEEWDGEIEPYLVTEILN